MNRSRRIAPPKALEVETVGGLDEFVLLSWPVAAEVYSIPSRHAKPSSFSSVPMPSS